MHVLGNHLIQLETILRLFLFVLNQIESFHVFGTKSWRALENNAILYSRERFMKGELDYIMLCIEVITVVFCLDFKDFPSSDSGTSASSRDMFSVIRQTLSQKE